MIQQTQPAGAGVHTGAAGRPGALIVGASTGMGAALARVLAGRGYTVALVGRQAEKLGQVAQDIAAKSGGASGSAQQVARAYALDIRDYAAAPELFGRIAQEMAASGAELQLVVYAAGVMPGGQSGQDGQWSFEEEQAMLETNAVGAMRWLGLAAESFRRKGRGTVAAISSVAGDRGRRGNSAYMASKAALSTYMDSLRFRLRGTGVRVVTLKPGFVATPMTAGVKTPKPLTISADAAAKRIAAACEGGSGVKYVPGYWGAIMWVIRALPSSVLARLPI